MLALPAERQDREPARRPRRHRPRVAGPAGHRDHHHAQREQRPRLAKQLRGCRSVAPTRRRRARSRAHRPRRAARQPHRRAPARAAHRPGLPTSPGSRTWAATSAGSTAKLDTISDPDQRTIIDRFARWHLLRQLRDRARRGPISDGAFLNAKHTTTVTIGFLAWLAERGTVLGEVTQHDLDAWFAHGPSTRKHAVRFLYWARDQRLLPHPLEVPVPRTQPGDPTGTRQRLALLHRALTDPALGAIHLRVAAALVLLFGATPRQLTGLTLADITDTGDQTWLRVGSDPLPLPDPVAELLHGLAADPRYRRNTTNHDSRWLFPGTRPGRPIHPNTLAAALQRAGIPAQSTRAGTWLDLVRSAPAPLHADALGVSRVTAARYAERAGVDYATYQR